MAINGHGTGKDNSERRMNAQFQPRVADVESVAQRYLSLKGAAQYTSLSYYNLREMCYLRKLPSIKVGKRILIEIADLDEFLQARKETANGGV